jgi:3-dehydrosphinganine reductase
MPTIQPFAIALLALSGASVALLLWRALARRAARFDLAGRVVLITGGSSGIGKAAAARCLAAGAHVALMARKPALLEAAQLELVEGERRRRGALPPAAAAALPPSPRVTVHAGDVADDEAARRCVTAAAAAHGGRIDCVVASAGVSCPNAFEETPAAEFAGVLATNVTGVRNAVFHALPFMGRGGGGGRLVLVSSMCGQLGLYGFSAYCASKFALSGLAQALAMELHSRRILVSLCYPPDTDTPLLALENETKHAVTKAISETVTAVSADHVGRAIVDGMVDFDPHISFGFDGWMLASLTAGMSPAHSWLQAAIEVLTLGIWRLVAIVFVSSFYGTIAKLAAQGSNKAKGGDSQEEKAKPE